MAATLSCAYLGHTSYRRQCRETKRKMSRLVTQQERKPERGRAKKKKKYCFINSLVTTGLTQSPMGATVIPLGGILPCGLMLSHQVRTLVAQANADPQIQPTNTCIIVQHILRMESHSTHSCMSGFFHSALCFRFILADCTRSLFLMLNDIPMYEYIITIHSGLL